MAKVSGVIWLSLPLRDSFYPAMFLPSLCTLHRREQILPQLQKAPAIPTFRSEVNPRFSTPESASRLNSKQHKRLHYDNPLQSFRERNERLSGTRRDTFLDSPVYDGAPADL